MPESPEVLELLLRWEELRDAGVNATPEQLCAGRPELLDAVRAALARLGRIDGQLKVARTRAVEHPNDSDAAGTSPSALDGTDLYRPEGADANAINLRDFLAPAQSDDELGRLGHYRVLKELGQGGMGMVLLAEDLHLERRVALKIILPGQAGLAQTRERFLREARAAAKLNHDNVVTIYQVGEERGILFIAMELLKGNSLDSYLIKNPNLSIGQVIRLAREMLEGLKAAHAVGLIHRDIKPANIWLEAPKGRVKILDFGLARDQKSDGQLTHSGAIIGTPKFMSPEQADGQSVDARSDLFSFGVVLYRLCSGKEPFTGPTLMAVLKALAVDEPPPLRQLNPNVPRELEQLVTRLLAKDPAQRIQTAKDVGDKLIRIQKALAAGSSTSLPQVHDLPLAREVREPPMARELHDLPIARPVERDTIPSGRATPSSKKLRKSKAAETARQPVDVKKPHAKTPFLVGAGVGLAIGLLILLFGVFFLTRDKHKAGSPSDTNAADTAADNNNSVKKGGVVNPPTVISKKSNVEERKPGNTVDVMIGKGVKMTFCWIPAGKATLGSPGTERSRRDDEKEREFLTKGFWLGKYPVTQEEWEAIMGNNPSWFSKQGSGRDKVLGKDTSRFPVEQVSWDDCQEFLDKLNRGVPVPAGMAKGKWSLPHEDQWEYACRGGKGNQQAFYFGDALNGRQANGDGNHPYGTATKGPYLERTAMVGSYEKEFPHPWGLCDMHGNVWEWCDNLYSGAGKARILRGGSWYNISLQCRSAYRNYVAPGNRNYTFGFRVAILLD